MRCVFRRRLHSGTVFTGASFTGVTLSVTVAVSVTPPEVTV